jgi:hypothetical protein
MNFCMKKFLLLRLMCALTAGSAFAAQEWTVASHEKSLAFKLSLDDGRLNYQVSRQSHGTNVLVVESSPLEVKMSGRGGFVIRLTPE